MIIMMIIITIIGPRFVRLRTQTDGLLPADKFVELKGTIPHESTTWHQGVICVSFCVCIYIDRTCI